MISINIREFSHNIAKYLRKVKQGERVIIMERNVPIADITPHNENISRPGWKREIRKLEIPGESFTETIVKNRRDEAS